MAEAEVIQKKKNLELIHIVYLLFGVLIAVGIGWGTLTNQQKTNCAEIDKKLAKEVFEMYKEEQRTAITRLHTTLDNGLKRIEDRIDKKLGVHP
jgi:hypothetical protein